MRIRLTVAIAATAAITLSSCGSPNWTAQPGPLPAATSSNALTWLDELPVRPAAPSGYSRDAFDDWQTNPAAGPSCDTRDQVLLTEAIKPPTQGNSCSLTGGRWHSVYDDTTVTKASSLDIDHVVSLKNAWSSGAHSWPDHLRAQFSNDTRYPDSLIAVTASSNRSKSHKSPDLWMPSDRSYHCRYAATWTAVKHRWNLSVTPTEHDHLANVLTSCPTTTVPSPPPAHGISR